MTLTIAPFTTTQAQRTIIRYLYTHRQATKQQIARELNLSMPTITQQVRKLTASGIIAPGPLLKSTGGRQARTIIFNRNHRLAIGIATTPTTATLRAINLYGETVTDLNRTLPWRGDTAYWQRISTIANDFATQVIGTIGNVSARHAIDNVAVTATSTNAATATNITTVLGIGLCVHDDRQPVVPLNLTQTIQTIHYPYTLVHPADAAATAEAWFDPTVSDAICIYLDRMSSGSLIINGQLHQPQHVDSAIPHRNGAIEHMALVPDGRECQCGRRGCMAAYCSPQTLPEDYESIPGFFSVLEQGETHHRERMNQWLDYVAQAIVNARSIVAGDVIIGGEAAQYLDHHDIAELTRRVIARSALSTDHGTHSDGTHRDDTAQPQFTLRTARADDRQHLTGAALPFVTRYLTQLTGGRVVTAPPQPAQ